MATHTPASGRAQRPVPQIAVADLLANIRQVIWSFDPQGDRLLYVSPLAYQMCGTEVEMPVPCLGWISAEERDPVHAAWQRALRGEMAQAEARTCDRDGLTRWFRWLFHPCLDASGALLRIDGVMEDVSERRELSERLEKLTTTDGLTGLPNRTLFRDRLAQAIDTARRDSGHGAVVMVMDLDHFKEVNDTLGHQCGDRVLVEVARRIGGTLRGTDTVTRLGGDEFAMLLSDTANSKRTAEKVASKLLAELARPFSVDGRELSLNASIGIAMFPEHGDDVDTLLGRADVAMYACKGRDARYLFYDDTLNSNTPQRLQLTAEIRRSIERGELVLHYQPIASLRERRIIGVEALIRWNHPERGLVAPDDFVPLAERSGLIKPITDWVIETALTQASAWRLCGL
ncbi:MAG: diguanylate cyclase, partial [Betaproteobacteria bacterium]|nr:diguanylate cyclase [Betaproteobacteria bacterium]